MILSGNAIREQMRLGRIDISPFNEEQLNPNSYNLRLADEILTYDNALIDMKKDTPYTIHKIPEDGYLLIPGKLYLARTVEYTKTYGYVPMIEGRSSIGKDGVSIHVTAGFGDNGFEGYWTLELYCIQPAIIYPNIEIAQIYYHTIEWATDDGFGGEMNPILYNGKYQNSHGIETSKIWTELK